MEFLPPCGFFVNRICLQGLMVDLVARRWRVPYKRMEYVTCNKILRITSDPSQPFLWQRGQTKPNQNEWSWTNLSSVLYVEPPIGTGFTQGRPAARGRGLRVSMST